MPTDPPIQINDEFFRTYAKLSKEDLLDTLNRVSLILDKEPKLMKLDRSRIFFLGDTHGNLAMTAHALKHLFPPPNTSHSYFDRVVFLGDFIDRGSYSIENINLLMSMKRLFPDRVILIRGNHETREINVRFDFYENVIRRYGMAVFERYNQIFAKLPLAVLTWNKVFALHGGIPEGLDNLNEINGLQDMVNPDDRIMFQILWNDPVEKDGWFFRNFRGKYSQKFGREAFKFFMKKHDIKLFLRAHEVHKEGFKEFFDTKLISLDSSTTKRRKSTMKVFILEDSGEHRITEVEDFENTKFSKIFG